MEARIDVREPREAAQQQRRADEQHDRQCDFGNEQRVAHPSATGQRRGSSAFLEHVRERRAGGVPRGRQPEEQPGQQRDSSANASTVASIDRFATRGMLPALSVLIGPKARYASSSPSAPPPTTGRGFRPASAARDAAVPRRAPRGSRSPSLAPTRARGAGWRRSRRRSASRRRRRQGASGAAGRMSPTMCSSSRTTSADSLALSCGYCWARRSEIVFISASACSRDTPGLSRAITPRKCPPRVAFAGLNASGVQISVVSRGEIEIRRHHPDDRDWPAARQ